MPTLKKSISVISACFLSGSIAAFAQGIQAPQTSDDPCRVAGWSNVTVSGNLEAWRVCEADSGKHTVATREETFVLAVEDLLKPVVNYDFYALDENSESAVYLILTNKTDQAKVDPLVKQAIFQETDWSGYAGVKPDHQYVKTWNFERGSHLDKGTYLLDTGKFHCTLRHPVDFQIFAYMSAFGEARVIGIRNRVDSKTNKVTHAEISYAAHSGGDGSFKAVQRLQEVKEMESCQIDFVQIKTN